MDDLSIKKKWVWLIIAIMILIGSASFAAGYLYRGQSDHAPIIIEKCST